jgi:DNA-directed RNA polymerase subunit RPC12/RpoP
VSLNPALEDARYCPRCGSEATVRFPRSITCDRCGYGAFYNPKPVACAITANEDDDVGVYSRRTDRIVVVVYSARAKGTPTVTEEALEVQAFRPTTIPWDELAFWSDDRALRDYLSLTAASAAAGSS